MRNVLVVSHADADGHVIAEQVRRNLALVPTFHVSTIVDPERTKDHKTWTKLDAFPEIETAELVFFVDLMFAPASFTAEAEALVEFVSKRPAKRFFVLDHHPVPFRLLERAPNLRALYQRDVVDCTFGIPSWMMCIAALLEKQHTRIGSLTTDTHKQLAEGIRRAAAPGGPLPGEKLLNLLRFECWDELVGLGLDDATNHRLPRGRRPRKWKASEPLRSLDELATKLVRSGKKPAPGRRKASTRRSMSYDLEIAREAISSKAVVAASASKTAARRPARSTDLEAIVMLLELAAISLTSSPGDTFTAEQLFDEARQLGGDEIVLDRSDVDIVLDKASFLKKQKKNVYQLK